MKLWLFALSFFTCISLEAARAEDDIFQPQSENLGGKAEFKALEEANADLAPGANQATVTAAAPADLVSNLPDDSETKPKNVEEDIKDEVDYRKVRKVERDGNIEKLTLKNGDVVINVKGKADMGKTLNKILGGGVVEAEAPLRPTEDWAKLPSNTN